ncbi:MAG: hypothetical protein ACTS73_03625 [Arsenophonus sp. NEOnobi-MAG3]
MAYRVKYTSDATLNGANGAVICIKTAALPRRKWVIHHSMINRTKRQLPIEDPDYRKRLSGAILPYSAQER